jgi:hypothetical protein
VWCLSGSRSQTPLVRLRPSRERSLGSHNNNRGKPRSDGACVWGSQAHGYCYSGACWYRAGSQASDCALSPNRTAGTLTKSVSTAMGYGYGVLGCMTKTSGPNTACGGTNTSLYVRTISGFTSTNCD